MRNPRRRHRHSIIDRFMADQITASFPGCFQRRPLADISNTSDLLYKG